MGKPGESEALTEPEALPGATKVALRRGLGVLPAMKEELGTEEGVERGVGVAPALLLPPPPPPAPAIKEAVAAMLGLAV